MERAVAITTEYEETELGREPLRRLATWTTPRQSGKSVAQQILALSWMSEAPGLHGIYMAQNRLSATNRLRGMTALCQRAGLDHKATFGVGNEKLILYVDGEESVIQVMAPTESAAHGESLDLAILDEIAFIDPIVMQGITPAMAARPEALLLMVSTAGTLAGSDLLNGLVAQGSEYSTYVISPL